MAYIRADWIRVRGRNEEMPPFPTRMLYVRALANAPAEEVVLAVPAPALPTRVMPTGVVSAEQEGARVVPLEQGSGAVVPTEHVAKGMDWLTQLIEEADRDDKS